MGDYHVAWDAEQVLSPQLDGVVFVPRYKRNQLWVQSRDSDGDESWIRRANRPTEEDGTHLSDPSLRLVRRNPNDAGTFQGAARDLRNLFGWPESRVVMIDNGAPNRYDEGDDASDADMRSQVMRKLEDLAGEITTPLGMVSFICHGWNVGIQFGFRCDAEGHRNRTLEMLQAIANISREDLVVPIYGCSTAGGPNNGADGFANFVRTSLVAMGITHCRVDGHTIAGHATNLPKVRRFEGSAAGGTWIIDPGDSELYPNWRDALHDPHSNLKYRYPHMSLEAIRAEVRSL